MSREFYVPCTPYTYQIRSKLPKIGHYLKRLMRSTSGEEISTESGTAQVAEITESMLNCAIVEISNVSERNEQTIPEDEDSVDWFDSHVVSTRWYETHSEPTNHFTGLDSEGPSTSATNGNTSEYQTNAMIAQTEPVPMISNSVNTAEATTTNGIFVNILNRDTSIAENILEFTEALSTQLGTRPERLRDQESRTITLVNARREDHTELYLPNTENGESEFSGSSVYGFRRGPCMCKDDSPLRFPPKLAARKQRPEIGQDDASSVSVYEATEPVPR